jgi:hypothetical protein
MRPSDDTNNTGIWTGQHVWGILTCYAGPTIEGVSLRISCNAYVSSFTRAALNVVFPSSSGWMRFSREGRTREAGAP